MKEEFNIVINIGFDLEPSFEEGEGSQTVCSPVGLQLKTFVPFRYDDSISALFYRLRPEEEVILQPGMMVKLG